MRQVKKNIFIRSGFTLIELVVALGIISFLASFSVIQVKGFTRTRTLDALADRVAFSIRRAQLWALVGERTNGSRPAGGYGLQFTPCAVSCTYTVFADVYPGGSPNHQYDPGAGQDIVVVQEILPPTMQITALSTAPNATIAFTPPQGNAFVNGGIILDQLSFRIQPIGSTEYREIRIERRSGLVTVITN